MSTVPFIFMAAKVQMGNNHLVRVCCRGVSGREDLSLPERTVPKLWPHHCVSSAQLAFLQRQ